jgi:hypothetical protein
MKRTSKSCCWPPLRCAIASRGSAGTMPSAAQSRQLLRRNAAKCALLHTSKWTRPPTCLREQHVGNRMWFGAKKSSVTRARTCVAP